MTRTEFPQLSVVMIAYRSAAVLPGAIGSVRRLLPGAEVVVVDNGDSDEDVAIASSLGAVVVTGHGNIGFGSGVNCGARVASGSHLLVLNPDAPIVTVAASELQRLLLQDGRLGVVAAHEACKRGTRPLLRSVYPWRTELLWMFAAWFLVPAELEMPRPRLWGRRQRFSGAAFVVSRREFLELGGFDERLFLYHEDEELSARYSKNGYDVRASDAVVVAHDQGTSSARNHERILAWQLLSFVQVESRGDPGETARVARSVIRGLTLIQALGNLVARVPVLGVRASKKAASANDTLRHLVRESHDPPNGTTYPDAGPAFRSVFSKARL